jgi:hypothetical protein
MRGSDKRSGDIFSYLDIEERFAASVAGNLKLVNEVLAARR